MALFCVFPISVEDGSAAVTDLSCDDHAVSKARYDGAIRLSLHDRLIRHRGQAVGVSGKRDLFPPLRDLFSKFIA